MNRRDFLVSSSLLTTAGLMTRTMAAEAKAPDARPATSPAPATPEFKPLRRDVGFFTMRGGSIGWLSSKDGLAAVDTQFPDTAAVFLKGLPGRADRKLDVLVNSHHHGDHTGGNGVLKPETKMIVAHANVPGLQRARAERDGTLDRQTYADTTFPSTWRKEIGSEVISAKYHGAAHTNGDIVTHFEKANVIHMGDLMFNRIYPVIDRPGGASIRNWIVVLETVAKTYPADAIYIFGHGNSKFGVTGKSSDLLIFRDYLSALLDFTQKKINAGEAKEKIVATENLPGFGDFHLPVGPANRFPANLGVAYDELTAKK
jgi:cyclase